MQAPIPRRDFLKALAAMGTGTVLPFGDWAAFTTQSKWIDVHHHILPPFYLNQARDRLIAQGQGYLPGPVLEWTPERTLGEMDRSSVATAIVSISTPGIWFGQVQEARTLARQCNEYAAALVRDHPRRFGFFAAVPLPDSDGSLREIAYALDVLKANGIGLMTSYGDRWLGDSAFAPVFEELHRRRAMVYVHPTAANCCGSLIPHVPQSTIEYPHDTTRAVTSLLFSGSFGKYSGIRFIFSHAGGTVPMLAGRIARRITIKEVAEKLPNGIEYELRRLFYEVAGAATRPAMSALMSLVPVSQVLFGSDYPWLSPAVTANDLASFGLSVNDLDAIGQQNAQALFPELVIR